MVLTKNNCKAKISIKRYLFILSFISLLPINKLSADGIIFAPLARASYDFNLGYTISLGLGIQNCQGECSPGGYMMYSYSKAIQKEGLMSSLSQQLNKPKMGSNLSLGLYAGLGIASFRFGANRMLFKESTEKMWGVEASTQMLFFNGVLGLMYNNKSNSIQPNLGLGWGVF
tara:strand:+ start:647 stop:1162 length:516 start_codon:yes stop_codon:yes gene_type:complete